MLFPTLRLKGPMMALQGPRIDNRPQALPIPTRSTVTGLLGAALGLDRGEGERLQALQDGMRLAIVVHRAGVDLVDYQTADLGQPHMRGPMWVGGRGTLERTGGDTEGTRQQWRPYRCDADMTAIVELLAGAPYGVEALVAALDCPRRPLGLGRMSCPPVGRIAGEVLDAPSLEAAIALLPSGEVYLPTEASSPRWGDLLLSIPGRRDWRSGQHAGADAYVVRASR